MRWFALASLVIAGTWAGAAELPAPDFARPDFLVSNIDVSVQPGVDFFDFANGAWLKRNPIPRTESSWGVPKLVEEEINARLRQINEAATNAKSPAGSDTQKIGDFWATAMDGTKAEVLGLSPLQKELAMIGRIKTADDAIDVSFALRPLGVGAFCDVSVGQDEKQSDVMSVHISQGGLGLPDRDFYVNPEKGTAEIRHAYVAHMTRMLELLGRRGKDAGAAARQVMKFETALAKASRKLEDLRDPEANYNKMSPQSLNVKYTPMIAWVARLGAMSLRPTNVVVGQPEFFTALNRLLKKTPIAVLKDYLRLQLVSEYAPYLSKPWQDEHFLFEGSALSGQKEERPRWKRVLDSENHAMGMILGRSFVREYFPAKTRKRYVDLVQAVRNAYRERIDRLDWMTDATKARAREKLARITAKVGYPAKWKDYSALVIGTNSYCQNMMNANRWLFNDLISKFGKPVDRTEWEMPPQVYNAYYEPANNEIVLPAAIFTVPGIRDDDLDDAFVYGYAAGSTIGHEMTHGFDDEGRQFDADGNLKDWWTKQDATRFEKRAELMVTQFNSYEPLPGLHINGRASLGENLADYGGVLLALDAFKKTAQFRENKKIAGLTPLQRYFLGYAYSWLYEERDERLRRLLLSDVHSPAKWRVNGPLSNIPDFYDSFGVKPGQPMWRAPADRVHVW